MTKSGRKRKKADKAKVQLKKGAAKKSIRLPKGQNVTDSRVTTKTITLSSQLSTAKPEDGPLTRKKIGMKDLLSKLNSQSSSIRVDGLEGLMELVKTDDETSILEDHLSLLLNRIVPLSTDRESKIRKMANNIFSMIVKKVDGLQVEPMYQMISAHLCCGLSHIDTYIQRDSLKLLDEIIALLPELIDKNFRSILPNCLNQISTQKSSLSAATKSSGASSRTFSTTLDDKISALQWRKEVLQRVQKMFEIITKKATSSRYKGKVGSDGSLHLKPKPYEDYYMSLYEDDLDFDRQHQLTIEAIQNYRFYATFSGEQADGKNNGEKSYVETLFPLLLDTWSEAILSASGSGSVKSTPNNNAASTNWSKKNKSGNLISPDIAPILEAVVKTLHLIVEHCKNFSNENSAQVNGLLSGHEVKVSKMMLEDFPYDVLHRNLQRGNEKKSKVDPGSSDYSATECVRQINVSILLLYLDLAPVNKIDNNFVQKVLSYLKGMFNDQPTNAIVSQVSDLLLRLLELNSDVLSGKEIIEAMDSLISAMMEHHSTNPNLVLLIGHLATSCSSTISFHSVNQWITKLPEVLYSRNGGTKERTIAKELLKQNNKAFLSALPPHFNYFELMQF